MAKIIFLEKLSKLTIQAIQLASIVKQNEGN